MSKFGRNYRLEVGLSNGSTLSVEYPTTLQFVTHRDINPSPNTGTFRIYNLSQDHRNLVYHDAWNTVKEHQRALTVQAGYGNNLSYIFKGQVSEASSYRQEGAVDFITEINGYDGASSMIGSYSTWTIKGSVSKQAVIERLIQDMLQQGLKVGHVEFTDGTFPFGFTANDYTYNYLMQLTDYHCSVQNMTANILYDNTVIPGSTFVINSETGLLGAPKKYDSYVVCEMLFEPSMYVGQQVTLDSSSFSLFNGSYKVSVVEHSGIISGSVNGKCKTVVRLFALNKVLQLSGLIA